MQINWVKIGAGVSVLIGLLAVLSATGILKALATLAGVS